MKEINFPLCASMNIIETLDSNSSCYVNRYLYSALVLNLLACMVLSMLEQQDPAL